MKQNVNKKLFSSVAHRLAAVLLLMCLSATTAWAEKVVTITVNNSDGGTYSLEGDQLTITPNNGYFVYQVQWSEGDPADPNTPGIVYTLTSGGDVYILPAEANFVYITFTKKTNDVRVSFFMNGHGSQVAEQWLEIGDVVTEPADPEADGYYFLGWYRGANSNNFYDFETVLNKDDLPYNSEGYYTLSLTANWNDNPTLSGSCGDDLNWALSKSAGSNRYDVLTISGTGSMNKYSNTKRPWYSFRNHIKEIVINEGVTTIGGGAFQKLPNIASNIIIPATVTTIGLLAFRDINSTSSDVCIAVAAGSHLTSIDNAVFNGSNINIDLSNASELTTLPKKKKIFREAKGNVTLPSTLELIEGAKDFNSFYDFKGEHIYIPVPTGATFTVNGEEYSGPLTGGKADIIDKIFKNNRRTKLNSNKGFSLAMTGPDQYDITTDDVVYAYYYGSEVGDQITKARATERVTLSYDVTKVPAGQYVSGFTFDVLGVTATPNEDNTDYTFVMPAQAVSVTSKFADQVEYTLDLTAETQVIIPETMHLLFYTLVGYGDYDATLQAWCIDLNRDGQPDLLMTEPVGEDVEVAIDDDFSSEYTVKRLPGADAVTKNYHLAFDYPQPYKYNKVLVKLSNSYEEAEQPQLMPLDDDSDNSSMLTQWAGDSKTRNVIIGQRTLYCDGDWNTLCLPFDLTLTGSSLEFDGVEARQLTAASITDKTLNLTFSDPVTTLEAGVPYIIKWTAAAENIIEPVFLGISIPDISSYTGSNNYEKLDDFYAKKGYDNGAAGDQRVRFLGTYKSTEFTTEDKSILFMGGNNTLYYPQPTLTDPTQSWSETNPMIYPHLNAFRAYFKIGDDPSQVKEISAFNLNFGDDEVTSISEELSVKSEESADWFDLNGRRLAGKPTQKGMYIHGGKKVFVK